MWETLRAWEHKRIDWAFNNPWLMLIPIALYCGVLAYPWIEYKIATRKWFR